MSLRQDEFVVFSGFSIKTFEIKRRLQKTSEFDSEYIFRLASVVKIKPEICKSCSDFFSPSRQDVHFRPSY